MLSTEVQQQVTRAMDGLTHMERAAFVLRHFEGQSIDDISRALGLKANAAKHSIFRAVRKMRQYGPTAEEVKAAKTYLRGLYPMRFETNESVAAAIAEIRVYGLGDDWVEQFVPRIAAVTRAMATQVARKYLFDRIPALVVVGNAAVVRKQLAGLGTPRVVKPAELG